MRPPRHLLPAGALGDRYGRRRALLAGLTIFGLGSAAAMTVSSATALIGLRAVIGLGAALVMPATLSTITGTFPPGTGGRPGARLARGGRAESAARSRPGPARRSSTASRSRCSPARGRPSSPRRSC